MTKADRLAREAAKSAVNFQDAAYDDESCDNGDVRFKFTLNDTTYHIAVNKGDTFTFTNADGYTFVYDNE